MFYICIQVKFEQNIQVLEFLGPIGMPLYKLCSFHYLLFCGKVFKKLSLKVLEFLELYTTNLMEQSNVGFMSSQNNMFKNNFWYFFYATVPVGSMLQHFFEYTRSFFINSASIDRNVVKTLESNKNAKK